MLTTRPMMQQEHFRRNLAIMVTTALLLTLTIYAGLFNQTLLLQITLNGILLGGLYALSASGLALIFGVMRILNLAHGELVIIGAYIGFWMFTLLGVDPFVSLAVSFVALAVMGLLVYRFIVSKVARLGFDPPIIATFGLLLFLQAAMITLWTGDPRALVTSYSGSSVTIGRVVVPILRLASFVLSFAALLLLHLFLSRTYLGKALRATSIDTDAAELLGVPTKLMYQVAFAFGAAFAGLSGTLLGAVYSFEPTNGPAYLLRSLAVIALGGIESLAGVFVAGLILGLVESFSSFLIGGGFRNAVAFMLLLVVLLIRPTGIFGRSAPT